MSKKIKVIILLLAFCISFGLGFLSNYLINKHTEDKNISLNLRYMYTFPIVEYTDIWDKETYEATFYDMCNFEDNIYVVNNLGTLIKMTPSGDTK